MQLLQISSSYPTHEIIRALCAIGVIVSICVIMYAQTSNILSIMELENKMEIICATPFKNEINNTLIHHVNGTSISLITYNFAGWHFV